MVLTVRKRLLLYISITVAAAIAALYLVACSRFAPNPEHERAIVAEVDGHAVEPFEYYVYLSEQKHFFEATGGIDIWYASFGPTDAQTQAKLNALRQLALVRTTAAQARQIGLELRPESISAAEANANAHIAQLPHTLAVSTGSTFENILPIMLERQLLEYMYEEVTRNFVVSQADFEAFFEIYVLQHPNAVRTQASIASIDRSETTYPTSRQLANAVRRSWEDAQAFQYDGVSVNITVTNDLVNSGLPSGVIEATRNLELHQVSPILQTSDTYYIVRIDARQVVNATTLANSALEEYTKQMRDEIFNQAYLSWRESEPEIRINHEVFDTISINDLNVDLYAQE